MSNKFTYSTYTFDDSVIVSAEISTEQSLLSEHLSADTLSLLIRSDEAGDAKVYTVLMEWYTTVNDEGYVVNQGDLANYIYGDPITYYRDNVLYGKFYVTKIERVGDEYFQITAVSAIGMMAYMTHKGGVYPTTSIYNAKLLIDDIMSGTGFTYSVGTGISSVSISGWLPYSNKMNNLQQLCFAYGISVLKDGNGNLNFVFNTPSTTMSITPDRVKEGSGDNVFLAPATHISLMEHQYYKNPTAVAEEIYAYSGVSASNVLVLLDEPVDPSTYVGNGITFSEKGANYFIFSGSGTVDAIKYTHLQTEKSWTATTINGENNEITVSNATMVNGNNSLNVLNRLVKYYTQRGQSNLDFYVNKEKTGSYVSFDDRFGDEKSGFVSKLTLNLSKDVGGSAEVITNWYPSDTGNNFNAYQLIQTTGTINVPSSAQGKAGRFVLIGGFRGGQGGSAGQNGTAAVKDSYRTGDFFIITGGEGGTEGGKGGQGGVGCMVYSVDVASLPSSFTVTAIGAGGAGGNPAPFQELGDMGSLGGNTTITVNGTSYSSASGTENTGGFINSIDGTFYNYQGQSGYDNDTGYGGNGSQQGGSFTANGTTWNGGASGYRGTTSGYGTAYGGGGGGAAFGANGNKGGDGSFSAPNHTGSGGAGATPVAPTQASFPYGGNGGHGGGCGGGGGSGSQYYAGSNITAGSGGAGGSGSVGGQGSNGAVIFYYGS